MASSTAPQEVLSEFWEKYINKSPGKITRIFPPSLYASLLSDGLPKAQTTNTSVTASYDAAAEECRQKVSRIVRECRRTNEKWSDPDFDIEADFRTLNCLHGLPLSTSSPDPTSPPSVDGAAVTAALETITAARILPSLADMDLPNLVAALTSTSTYDMPRAESVHRVAWIYDSPAFTINGFDSSDVQQGGEGDCWWVAAVATLCGMAGQMERVCVARDEECGVYGFVFHRDGGWVSAVVDDNLYLSYEDYDSANARYYDPAGKEARKWKRNHQTGSEALAFAKCRDQNETWLPLLEKAYAKVHGDYAAIAGGFAGEGVEDMTGGVTTTVDTNKVLSKDALWRELLRTNKDFLFATGTPSSAAGEDSRSGLAYQHAYSIHKAVEEEDESGNKIRLVKIRNPWGKRDIYGEGEWNGPWSDGSKEWTPYWLSRLNYKFGDDGEFWMSYDDMLSRFEQLDRTRLFGPEWRLAQRWTSINVSWITGYINTKFVVDVQQAGPVIFVLSKLDDRYFKGLEGQYDFSLHFLLQASASAGEHDHIAHARPSSAGALQRSVSVEVLLQPGRYDVIPQIIATKIAGKPTVEDAVKDMAEKNPQKLRQIGLNYDIAHLKVAPVREAKKAAADEKKAEPEEKEAEPEAEETEPEEKEAEKETEPEEKEAELEASSAEEMKEADAQPDTPTASPAPMPVLPLGAPPPPPPPPQPIVDDPPRIGDKPVVVEDLPKPPVVHEESVWNAVCTIGLRVYSKAGDVEIGLEMPASAEEGAGVEVEGVGA